MSDVNVLVRGQSNALLFVDRGGAELLERTLEAVLGTNVNILARWGDAGGRNTINSATAFTDWDTGGQTAGLVSYLKSLPAELRDNPTITLWMHNEYDQQRAFTAADWMAEVQADAALVRAALGQGAATTPYVFTSVPYPFGQNWGAIEEGIARLAADPAFNARFVPSLQGAAMDGDGFAGSSHMGGADALMAASRLAAGMAGLLKPLAAGGETAAPAAAPVMAPAAASAPPAAPEPAAAPEAPAAPDWNAIAAEVMANHHATAEWFLF